MVSPAQVAEYRQVIDGLSRAAMVDGKALLAEVTNPNPIRMRDDLAAALPALLTPYTAAAGELGAVFYEDARRAAVGGTVAARVVNEVPAGLAAGIARHAMKPAFFQTTASFMSLLAAGLQKTVANAGRDTVIENVRNDATEVRYARSPQAGCCAFCAMLASRGAAYRSAQSGGGEGARFHSYCRCVVAPVWPGEDLPYDVARYEAMYDRATLPDEYDRPGASAGQQAAAAIRSTEGVR